MVTPVTSSRPCRHCAASSFFIELLFRIFAEGTNFCTGKQWRWNLFDAVLVATFFVDFLSGLAMESLQAKDMANTTAGRALRAARFMRIMRTFRLVRVTSYAHEFRKMAYALQYSVHTLFWALLLLFFVMYCFATTFTQAATDHFSMDRAALDLSLEELSEIDLHYYWGTLPRAFYSLYMALTNGIAWVDMVQPLSNMGGIFVALFVTLQQCSPPKGVV